MEELALDAIGEWESEGGAPEQPETTAAPNALTGTINQIEWAEQIKERVGKDFDRVAHAMQSVAAKQVKRDRLDTEELIAVLKTLRAEVMGKRQAGYFIHDWQEPGDQVRQMIVKDPRYAAIKTMQAARKSASKPNHH
jgi:hypothetical protein